jgi:hypothetical protein
LLKFKCGSPHRHPIVIRRDPQQLELRFGAVEGLSYTSAFFGADAIPATERNIIVNSHGDICRKYVFLHIAKPATQTSRSNGALKNSGPPLWRMAAPKNKGRQLATGGP